MSELYYGVHRQRAGEARANTSLPQHAAVTKSGRKLRFPKFFLFLFFTDLPPPPYRHFHSPILHCLFLLGSIGIGVFVIDWDHVLKEVGHTV